MANILTVLLFRESTEISMEPQKVAELAAPE
jgi:hypothetical protein